DDFTAGDTRTGRGDYAGHATRRASHGAAWRRRRNEGGYAGHKCSQTVRWRDGASGAPAWQARKRLAQRVTDGSKGDVRASRQGPLANVDLRWIGRAAG